jgi:4-amino-4-deoxy-L-arabinose transferase-like glycosyltransferase
VIQAEFRYRDIGILILIAGFVILWNLGTGSLLSWDEAVYAQVSKEILRSNNYIDLTWAGKTWSDKPPLYMWMTVVFYKIFGIGEFAARLFSALCGIGTVIVTYLLALKLYSRRAAFAASLILASTLHFIWASKVGMLDVALTFFISLSLYWFIIGMERKIFLTLSALAFGCAFLTKGFGALLIPIILTAYILITGKIKVLRERALWAGLFIVLVLVGFWHFMAIIHYGKEFVAGYVTKHLFSRVGQALDGHTGTIFTYFKVISNKGRPWGVAAFFIIPFALWGFFKKRGKSEHALPLIWFLATMIVFTAVRTKLNWYIVPIYPAISMLIGWGIDRALNKKTIMVVVLCFIVSLSYLAIGKHLFNLDYSHETKGLALFAKEEISNKGRIYIFDDDPAIRFYFLDDGINASGVLTMPELLREKNSYIVVNKKTLKTIEKSGVSIVKESPDFTIVKVN